MEEKRKGEIALAMLKYIVGQEGLKLNNSFRRKLGHIAKETGISMKELTEFVELLIGDLVTEHVKPQPK